MTHDAELRFKVEARRNRLLVAWAAEKKGLSGEAAETFIVAVIASDFQEAGDEDVFRKLRSELDESVSDAVIREKMTECLNSAVAEAAKALQAEYKRRRKENEARLREVVAARPSLIERHEQVRLSAARNDRPTDQLMQPAPLTNHPSLPPYTHPWERLG